MNFRLLSLALVSLLVVSCGTWGWESIETDNEEQLNVFGLIAVDDSLESFVVVHKTIDTAGPLEIAVGYDTIYYDAYSYYDDDAGVMVTDTFWYDPPLIYTDYESRHVVKDAIVTISQGNVTYHFERAPSEAESYWYSDIWNDPAIYLNVDGSFHPQPDTEYTLHIETPDGLTTTGTTRTPPIPEWYVEKLSRVGDGGGVSS